MLFKIQKSGKDEPQSQLSQLSPNNSLRCFIYILAISYITNFQQTYIYIYIYNFLFNEYYT